MEKVNNANLYCYTVLTDPSSIGANIDAWIAQNPQLVLHSFNVSSWFNSTGGVTESLLVILYTPN